MAILILLAACLNSVVELQWNQTRNIKRTSKHCKIKVTHNKKRGVQEVSRCTRGVQR